MKNFVQIIGLLLLFFGISEGQNSYPTLENTGKEINDHYLYNNTFFQTNLANIGRDAVTLSMGFEYNAYSNLGYHTSYINEFIEVPEDYSQTGIWTENAFNTRSLNQSLEVGETPASFAVTPTGGASYNVPIFASPGTNGMEPKLAVTYNSQAQNGILGYGWNLSGISVISRAPKTLYHNDITEGIQLNNTDWFTIDGNRLIQTGTNNGNPVYQKEIESDFSSIEAVGTTGSGPSYFILTTREGLVMEYGNTTNSTLSESSSSTRLSWYITKITDAFGNYMTFSYQNDNREITLSEINYTGNTSQGVSPYNKLKLGYTSRSDVSTLYVAGIKVPKTKLLHTIAAYASDEKVKQYTFNYGYTNYSFLTEIIENSSDDGKLNSTIFKYGSTPTGTVVAENDLPNTSNLEYLVNDYNRDGYSDVLVLSFTDSKQWQLGGFENVTTRTYQTWQLFLKNPNGGFYSSASGNVPAGVKSTFTDGFSPNEEDTHNKLAVGNVDFNGDGFADMFFTAVNANQITIHPYLANSTGTGFIAHTSINTGIGIENNFNLTGDFNGDGNTNLFIFGEPAIGSGKAGFLYYRNGAFSFNSYILSSSYSNILSDIIRPYSINFDGDATNEILGLTSHDEITVLDVSVDENSGFPVLSLESIYTGDWWSGFVKEKSYPHIGDFNGDGISDIISGIDNTNIPDDWKMLTGTGTSYITTDMSSSFETNFDNSTLYFMDINSDGRTDILRQKETSASTIQVSSFFGNGNEFFIKESQNYNFTTTTGTDKNQLIYRGAGYFNGDNSLDAIFHKYSTSSVSTGEQCQQPCWDQHVQADIDYINSEIQGGNGDYMTNDFNQGDFNNGTFPNPNLLETEEDLNTWYDAIYEGDIHYCWLDPCRLGSGGCWYAQTTVTVTANQKYIMYNGTDEDSRTLTKVKDGLNRQIEFTYANMHSNSDLYTPAGYTLYQEELAKVIGQNKLVRSVKTKTPTATDNSTTYSYKGAIAHKRGRGYLGFDEVETSNNLTNVTTTNNYPFNTTYFIRRHTGVISYYTDGGGMTHGISETANTYTIHNLGNGRLYQYPSLIKSTDFQTGTVHETTTNYNTSGILQSVTKEINDYWKSTETFTYGTYSDVPDSKTTNVYENGALQDSKTINYTYLSAAKKVIIAENYVANGGLGFSKGTNYVYDNFGNILSITNTGATPDVSTRTKTDSYTYDSKGRFRVSTTNSDGTSYVVYDPKFGNIIETTDIYGLTSHYEYNSFGKVTKTIYPNGNMAITTRGYNTSAPVSMQTPLYFIKVEGTNAPSTTVWYNAYSEEVGTETESFSGLVYTTTTYNDLGKEATKSLPFFSGETPINNVFQYHPNLLYLTSSQLGGQSATTISQTFNTTAHTTTITTSKPDGSVEKKTLDARGYVKSVEDASGNVLTYVYNGKGELYQVKNGSIVLSQTTYDDLGHQKTLVDKDAGTITYTYGPFGQLWEQTNPSGTENFYYDSESKNLTQTVGENGSWQYEYYPSNAGVKRGRLKRIYPTSSDALGRQYTYDYDSYGRLSAVSETFEGETISYNYDYDNNGNLIKTTYPKGVEINRVYTNKGYLQEVRMADGTLLWQASAANAKGQIMAYTMGNGKTTTKTFDTYGVPQRFYTAGVQDLNMYFGLNSRNMEWRRDDIINKTETFTYDKNRLNMADISGGPHTDIVYQANGNIGSKTEVGTYLYDANKIHALNQVSNDNNLITTNQTISYNAYQDVEQLTEGNLQLEYSYGVDKQRRKMTISNTTTSIVERSRYYFGDYERQEINGGPTHEVYYIAGGDGLAAMYVVENGQAEGTLHYVYKDHLGSIVAITDASGTVEVKQAYDAWGKERNATNWTALSSLPTKPAWLWRGYTGHEHLFPLPGGGELASPWLEVGPLIHMNGRLYDPLLGRMLSPDNYVQNPSDFQNYNRYAYVLNNPLKYVDPSGELGWLGQALVYLGFTYLQNAHANGWEFNPAKWNWSNATFVVGMSYGGGSTNVGGGFSVDGISGVSIGMNTNNGQLVGGTMQGSAINLVDTKPISLPAINIPKVNYAEHKYQFGADNTTQKIDYTISISGWFKPEQSAMTVHLDEVNINGGYDNLYASTVEGLAGKPYVLGADGPNAYDCSSTVCYGIRNAGNSGFGDYTANELYHQYTTPTNSRSRGTLIFYDWTSDGYVDHVTTILNNTQMLHPSSGAGYLQIKPFSYLENYKENQIIYYRQINWVLIINQAQ